MRKTLLAASLAVAIAGPAAAQISDDKVVIGLLTAMSGSASDPDGPGAIVAAQMAVEEFGGKVNGKDIVLLTGDHQSKPDVGSTLIRRWFDTDKMDLLTNVNISSVALAGINIAKDLGKLTLVTGATSSTITGKDCSPLTIHWGHDTYTQSNGLPSAVVKNGGDTWFFLTVDYVFGKTLQKDATDAVERAGGKVVGSVLHPFPGREFSSFLLQAQGSKAKVIAVANSGEDTVAVFKQAAEFGVTQTLVPFYFFMVDVRGIGLKATQGTRVLLPFYWDMNDETRAFSEKFFARFKKMPEANQASQYTALVHYLRAVQAAGTDEGRAVRKKMAEMPINDVMTKNGSIREDGRVIRDFYLFEVKKPAESKSEWDLFHSRGMAERATLFRPLAQSECPYIVEAKK